jgi:MFS transporter, putative metabolite:H+ symporter
MLEHLERQKSLTTNQYKIFAAAMIGDMLDFFDFYLIGFVLAFIIGGWHLTYGQSGAILLSSGIGAPLGSLFWGWMADKIGRRKVMILTVLNFSLATGAMAMTPHGAWIYLVVCRVLVGLGVTGLYSVDITVVQEFVPASKRGWITGLTTTMLPVGVLLGAALGAFATPYIGWRGMFAVGLLPALLTLYVRAWVPESPHWLMRMGRPEEARRSIAWALQVDPASIALPATIPPVEHTRWLELFRYPRSIIVGCLTGLTQTGGVGLTLWMVTLFVMVLGITAPEASQLAIWVSLAAVAGRFFCAWISDAMGRRASGVLSCLVAALFMSLAGYMHSVFVGGVSMFFVMIVLQNFFGSGNYSIVGPYMGELWPSRLRGSGMGLVYGVGNLGKFIGPAGLALIAGSANFVAPKATLDAVIPAFNYFAFWYVLGAVAFWFIGFETRGRTIEEIDATLSASAPSSARVPVGETR